MADSSITKNALAAALKELMTEVPFSKITISDICEKCRMNRKSFYYHFKDKYDLVNWIYDTEFITVTQGKTYNQAWDFLNDICNYFYENQEFYRAALKIKGQNSFSDHFREFLLPIIAEYLRDICNSDSIRDFQINFFADGLTCTLERWIVEKECMPPQELLNGLRVCVEAISHTTALNKQTPVSKFLPEECRNS